MALKMRYDPSKALRDVQNIEKALIRRMQYIGEQFVIDCRTQPQPSVSRRPDKLTGKALFSGPKEPVFEDQTANLRSSEAYFIVKNNTVIGGNTYGTPQGIEHAKQVMADMPAKSGLRLIGVAGMQYAAAVESLGYNVITKQSYVAIDNLHIQFERLTKKVGKKSGLLNDAEIY